MININSTSYKFQEWTSNYETISKKLKNEYLQSLNFSLATSGIDMQKKINEISPGKFFECYFDGRLNAYQVFYKINKEIINCYYKLEIIEMIETYVSHVVKMLVNNLFIV